ncbi:CRISPR-associated protein Csx19 [Streptosporangium sp. NPDC087985]|uniref:type III-D CRISPR-associated protein Csx19 n=1 Tax=Streptosporangium sp. NPDC087985 TaxID=3366196 RepID=UPI0037F5E739
MTTLYGAAATGVTLAQAMEAADVAGGCALLTAPSAYHVARVEAGGCVTEAGPVDLSTVYEARIFTSRVELRWVEAGYAVLLTEDESLLPAFFGERLDELSAETTLDARYLVWGEVKASTSGWVTLGSARIGTLTVPMATPFAQRRVRLAAREYVVADEVHGNAYVAEERLIGFEPYAAEGAA